MKKLILLTAILLQACFGQYRILSPLYLKKSNADTITARLLVSAITTARNFSFRNASGILLIDSDSSYLASKTFVDNKYTPMSRTITIAANTMLSSSAGAQNLYANRTWTLSADTSTRFLSFATDWDRINDSLRVADSINSHNTRINAAIQRAQDTLDIKKDKSDTTTATGYARNWDTPSLVESNTFSSGTTQTMPRASIDTLDVGSVILRTSAGLSIRKANIQTAIDDFTYGDMIQLSPGTYTEDLTIADSGVVIVGIDNKQTIVQGSVVITGKQVKLNTLKLHSSIITVLCSDEAENKKYIEFEGCFFDSTSIYDGNSTDTNYYSVRFSDCSFVGGGDTILINSKHYAGSNNTFFNGCNFEIGGYTMLLNNSRAQFLNCPRIFLDGLVFNSAIRTSIFETYSCPIVMFGDSAIRAENNETNYAVLSINDGYVGNYGTATTWTFGKKFEVDFRHLSLAMPDIVFNSTAISRWEWVEQRGWESTATLSGTGLANLYASNNIFRFSKPAGLGGNAGTRWGALIDD